MPTALLNSSSGEFAKHVTGPETPALFTTTSTNIPDFWRLSYICETPDSSLTSTPGNSQTLALLLTRVIISSRIFFVSSSGSFRLPKIMMLAPFSANNFATVCPIPVPLPVTRTTLF